LKEYRKTLNELYEKVRDVAPNKDNIPEFKIPVAEKEKGKHGTFYFYPFPEEAGLDKQVQPVLGIGARVAVLTLSKKHADRLLDNTTLKTEHGPLSHKGNLVALSVLNWPAFVDAVAPWAEFAVQATVGAPAGEADAAKKMAEGILKQVHVVVSVLKAFKGASSATYVEDDALVTHSEMVFKDIPAPKEK
jgi:hypothetical protein